MDCLSEGIGLKNALLYDGVIVLDLDRIFRNKFANY